MDAISASIEINPVRSYHGCAQPVGVLLARYSESMNFGEDVRFLLELRKLGRERGLKLARLSGAKALGSTRKWDQLGEWHFLAMMAEIFRIGGFRAQHNSELVDRYWYGDQREP